MQVQFNRIVFPRSHSCCRCLSESGDIGGTLGNRGRTHIIVYLQVVRVMVVNERLEVLHFDFVFVEARRDH